MSLSTFLHRFARHRSPAPFTERLRSGIAGGLGIFVLAWALHLLPQPQFPLLLLGSMAASAVLLYAVPHSPLAQPWNLIGGHLVSALAGWITINFVHDSMTAAGVAVGSAIFLMYALDCLHPPGAATALTLVLGETQFLQMGTGWTFTIVAANALLSLLLGLVINNALPRRHYPQTPQPPAAPPAPIRVLPEAQDIEWALEQADSMLDINREDLFALYDAAQRRAQFRFEAATRKS